MKKVFWLVLGMICCFVNISLAENNYPYKSVCPIGPEVLFPDIIFTPNALKMGINFPVIHGLMQTVVIMLTNGNSPNATALPTQPMLSILTEFLLIIPIVKLVEMQCLCF